MKQFRFDVVYDRAGQICEARFQSPERVMAAQDAASFADICEERGYRFRVWNPEGEVTRQSLGADRWDGSVTFAELNHGRASVRGYR